MTCIIGIINNNNIYLGSDLLGSNGHNCTHQRDDKLFRKGNMLIGCSGSYRITQLLKYKFKLPYHDSNLMTDEYINTIFIDNFIKCLDDNKYTKPNDKCPISDNILIGYNNRIFKIQSDYSIIENSYPYLSIGSGAETAMGALTALTEHDSTIKPQTLIHLALKAAGTNICTVHSPFKIMSLKKR